MKEEEEEEDDDDERNEIGLGLCFLGRAVQRPLAA